MADLHNIFISHYGEDEKSLDSLKQRLRDHGCDVRNSSVEKKKYRPYKVTDATIARYLRLCIRWAKTFIVMIGIHGINFRRSVSVITYRMNNDLVQSVFVYRSSECHVIIVLTGIDIPIIIYMCNSFGVCFQIFKTFVYKKLKNSEYRKAY